MPLLEFQVPVLTPLAKFYLNQLAGVRQYYDENYMDGVDPNMLVQEALEAQPFSEDILQTMILSVSFVNKLLRKSPVRRAIENCDKRKFWLITFTSDPKETEVNNIINITRYRQNHFKKYKHVWVAEKESADSKKYHQHILIECPDKVARTDQNLKPVNYYKGNVNVRKVTPTKADIDDVLTYFSKEGKPQGDLEYFSKLQF